MISSSVKVVFEAVSTTTVNPLIGAYPFGEVGTVTLKPRPGTAIAGANIGPVMVRNAR